MAENPNAAGTWATLRIWGDDLDPATISTHLALTPSRAFKRGDIRGQHGVWRHGCWGLTSEDQVFSTDLALHIAWVLDKLEPVQLQLQALREDPGISADVFCFWASATGNGGPVFSPTLLGRLAALNLVLGLDIYFVGEDCDSP